MGLSQFSSLVGEIQSSSISKPAGGGGGGDIGGAVWHAIDTLECLLCPCMAQELGAVLWPSTGESHSVDSWWRPFWPLRPLGDRQSIINPRLASGGTKKFGANRPFEFECGLVLGVLLFLRWPIKSAIRRKGDPPLLRAL